ncbi:MAG: hypothetical protein ACJ76Z_10180 [Thermoleophilaceae bacterium]
MPRLRALRATPWGRIIWLAQIVVSGIRELEASERRQARELIAKLARERRLSPKERLQLRQLARKVSKGAARGARGRGRRR